MYARFSPVCWHTAIIGLATPSVTNILTYYINKINDKMFNKAINTAHCWSMEGLKMEDIKNEDVVSSDIENEKEDVKKVEENVVDDKQQEIAKDNETITKENEETVPSKKSNAPLIVLAVLCVALLVCLLITNFSGGSKTYKLSAIYPTYFSEVDGEITLPKGWLYTEQGQLYRSEEGKATLVGQVVGTEMTEDEFTSTIDSFSSYYELNEVEGKDAKTYYFHVEQDESVYDVYFYYKDSTFVQVALLDASESEVNTVVNSVNY